MTSSTTKTKLDAPSPVLFGSSYSNDEIEVKNEFHQAAKDFQPSLVDQVCKSIFQVKRRRSF